MIQPLLIAARCFLPDEQNALVMEKYLIENKSDIEGRFLEFLNRIKIVLEGSTSILLVLSFSRP